MSKLQSCLSDGLQAWFEQPALLSTENSAAAAVPQSPKDKMQLYWGAELAALTWAQASLKLLSCRG